MFKNAPLLLIVFMFFSPFAHAQYEDDAPPKKVDTGGFSGNEILFKDKLVKGAEFMVSANTGVFYLDLAPLAAVQVTDYFMAGIGINGSFLGAGSSKYTYYGARAFARLSSNQYFLHGEYNLLNGQLPGSTVRRTWVASPVIGLGMMVGESAWVSFGYAFNSDFQKINPFGGLVYHFGFYF